MTSQQRFEGHISCQWRGLIFIFIFQVINVPVSDLHITDIGRYKLLQNVGSSSNFRILCHLNRILQHCIVYTFVVSGSFFISGPQHLSFSHPMTHFFFLPLLLYFEVSFQCRRFLNFLSFTIPFPLANIISHTEFYFICVYTSFHFYLFCPNFFSHNENIGLAKSLFRL